MSLHISLALAREDLDLDVSLDIPAQGITVLYGESGAGKTTILRTLAGLDKHALASVRFADQLWQSGQVFVPAHRRNVGFVFQQNTLFGHLDVHQNIHYGRSRRQNPISDTEMDQLIDVFALGALLDRMPESLSGGEQRRVEIARALACRPGLLLLDEPMSGLDQGRKQEVLPYIAALPETTGIPIVYVSHIVNEVAQLADHMVMLQRGQVLASGKAEQLLTRFDLPLAHDRQSAALIQTEVLRHDEKYHLSYLGFGGGELAVERINLSRGTRVRVQLAARDVSIALQQPSSSSILNVLQAEIVEFEVEASGQVLVKTDCNGVQLLARITQRSVDQLRLRKGQSVYLQIKSVAVLV